MRTDKDTTRCVVRGESGRGDSQCLRARAATGLLPALRQANRAEYLGINASGEAASQPKNEPKHVNTEERTMLELSRVLTSTCVWAGARRDMIAKSTYSDDELEEDARIVLKPQENPAAQQMQTEAGKSDGKSDGGDREEYVHKNLPDGYKYVTQAMYDDVTRRREIVISRLRGSTAVAKAEMYNAMYLPAR